MIKHFSPVLWQLGHHGLTANPSLPRGKRFPWPFVLPRRPLCPSRRRSSRSIHFMVPTRSRPLRSSPRRARRRFWIIRRRRASVCCASRVLSPVICLVARWSGLSSTSLAGQIAVSSQSDVTIKTSGVGSCALLSTSNIYFSKVTIRCGLIKNTVSRLRCFFVL